MLRKDEIIDMSDESDQLQFKARLNEMHSWSAWAVLLNTQT